MMINWRKSAIYEIAKQASIQFFFREITRSRDKLEQFLLAIQVKAFFRS